MGYLDTFDEFSYLVCENCPHRKKCKRDTYKVWWCLSYAREELNYNI